MISVLCTYLNDFSLNNFIYKIFYLIFFFVTPWDSPGQATGVGSLSLLQGIFPTQGSNSGLPRCRWTLYQLSHQGSSENARSISVLGAGIFCGNHLRNDNGEEGYFKNSIQELRSTKVSENLRFHPPPQTVFLLRKRTRMAYRASVFSDWVNGNITDEDGKYWKIRFWSGGRKEIEHGILYLLILRCFGDIQMWKSKRTCSKSRIFLIMALWLFSINSSLTETL